MPHQNTILSKRMLMLFGFSGIFIFLGIVAIILPELIPPLAKPKIAWSLIFIGVILESMGIFQLIANIKKIRDNEENRSE